MYALKKNLFVFPWFFVEEGNLIVEFKEEFHRLNLLSIAFTLKPANNVAHILTRKTLIIFESVDENFLFLVSLYIQL